MINLQTQIAKWTLAYKWHKIGNLKVFVTGNLYFMSYDENGKLAGKGQLTLEEISLLFENL